MELIYLYIDKYRTFEKQVCAFSNKFKVNYNAETKDLTITRNKDYFDIYPGNILGVNAVLGKNASGKTSFMSLIGDRINDRRNEIYIRPEKPHDLLEILTAESEKIDVAEGRFVSKYFFVYYYGKDNKGEDLFILETCCPEKYIYIFENKYILLDREDKEGERRGIDYYIEKGWMSCVFKIENNKNIWCDNTQNYKVDGFSPEMDSSIIFFKNSVKKDPFRFNDRDEEESIISVKRIESVMEDVSFFQKVDFLIGQMKRKTDTIYNDKRYILRVEMAERLWSDHKKQLGFNLGEAIPDYRCYLKEISEVSEEQKIVLAFLNKYVNYILSVVVKEGLLNNEQIECINAIESVDKNAETYDDLKEIYHKQIGCIYEYYNQKDVNLDNFMIVEKSFEDFLEEALKNNIEFEYKIQGLDIKFQKESNIKTPEIKKFFDNCIDEYLNKAKEDIASILENFLTVDILWLSAGEEANLTLFTAIHNQVKVKSPDKRKYIFLFDEIERYMHPEMCRCLISDLIDLLNTYNDKEFQIMISSHSSFIASDIKNNNVICLERKGIKTEISTASKATLGQNIHTILKENFFLSSTFGKYAIKIMELVEKCLNADELNEAAEIINSFIGMTEQGDSKRAIETSEEVIQFLETVIDSIGEKTIRYYFKKKLNEKTKNLSIDERIQYYKREIEKLRMEGENNG